MRGEALFCASRAPDIPGTRPRASLRHRRADERIMPILLQQLHRPARLATAGMLLLLGGCGSSGGSAPAPEPLRAAPHVLQATQAEANALAVKTAASALTGLRVSRDLESLDDIGGLTRELVPRVFDSEAAAGGTGAGIDCRRNPLRLAPLLCSGSMHIEVSQREVGDTIVAGTFFDLQFDKFQVFTPAFERLRISGGLRIDYVTVFDTRARQGTLTYQSHGLSTNHDGTLLEASEGALTVHYGENSVVVETATERFTDLRATSASDMDGTVTSGAILSNFGAGHIDIRHAGWTTTGGTPQPGSAATITGGDGSAATVTVESIGSLPTQCRVTIGRAGVSTAFVVEFPLR